MIPSPQPNRPTPQGAPLSHPMPPLFIAWLPPSAPLPHPDHVTVPLYATQERTEVLAEVQLPVAGGAEAEGWMLAGVALVLPPL